MGHITGILCILFILSSSMTNKLYSKIGSKKLISHLIESNGNVFYVSSTHLSISFVWSYSDNEVVIYKLSKGKVVNTKVLSTNVKLIWTELPSKEEQYELDPCIELDGDIFGCKFKKDGKVEQLDLPISLECFARGKYKSDFINKVANDIITYQIKW